MREVGSPHRGQAISMGLPGTCSLAVLAAVLLLPRWSKSTICNCRVLWSMTTTWPSATRLGGTWDSGKRQGRTTLADSCPLDHCWNFTSTSTGASPLHRPQRT